MAKESPKFWDYTSSGSPFAQFINASASLSTTLLFPIDISNFLLCVIDPGVLKGRITLPDLLVGDIISCCCLDEVRSENSSIMSSLRISAPAFYKMLLYLFVNFGVNCYLSDIPESALSTLVLGFLIEFCQAS